MAAGFRFTSVSGVGNDGVCDYLERSAGPGGPASARGLYFPGCFYRWLILLCLGAWLFLGHSGWTQVKVVKTAADRNSTLSIASFDGPADLHGLMKSVLNRCGWFSFVTGGKSDYSISVRYIQVGSSAYFDVRIAGGGGADVVFREGGSSEEREWLVYRTVDSLIEKVFQNPGLCSTKIAFAVGWKGCKEVYMCNFDGRDAERLTRNGTISTEPSWGRDAATIVYTLYQNNTTNVVLIDVENNRQRRLSQFRGLNAGADLSPNGKWAALSLSRDRRIDLYLLSVETGQLRRLTNSKAVESSPCWSPDGSRICYVSDSSARPQLYVIPVGGGRAARLLREPVEAVSPDWSPVSNKICFATRMGREYTIGVVDMSDSSRTRKILVRKAGDWESPSWAPDGRHIVCSHRVGGQGELCIVDSLHGSIQRITTKGDYSLPSWSGLF